MKVYTNATKRDKDHTIDISADVVLNFIIPRYKIIGGKKFKYIKAYDIKPGLTLHYSTVGGEVKLGIEEPKNGVAETWYTKDILEEAAKYEKSVGHPITVWEDDYSI